VRSCCGETLCCGDRSTPWVADKITNEWLTAILRESGAIGPGVTVNTFKKEDLSGIGLLSCMWRLVLGYEGDAAKIENAPATVIIKFTSPEFKQRFVSAWFGFYRGEIAVSCKRVAPARADDVAAHCTLVPTVLPALQRRGGV
jgi:hypothetical protein